MAAKQVRLNRSTGPGKSLNTRTNVGDQYYETAANLGDTGMSNTLQPN